MAVDHAKYVSVESRRGIIEPRLEALALEHYDLTHRVTNEEDQTVQARIAYLEERISEFEAEAAALDS